MNVAVGVGVALDCLSGKETSLTLDLEYHAPQYSGYSCAISAVATPKTCNTFCAG